MFQLLALLEKSGRRSTAQRAAAPIPRNVQYVVQRWLDGWDVSADLKVPIVRAVPPAPPRIAACASSSVRPCEGPCTVGPGPTRPREPRAPADHASGALAPGLGFRQGVLRGLLRGG